MIKTGIGSHLVAGFVIFGLAGCDVQAIPRSENDVNASSAEVTNQYK